MDSHFSALASRVASRGDVLGCLIVSRDGVVVGAFPPDGEGLVKQAWLRCQAIGEPTRGFMAFPHEVWVVARGPNYAGFALAIASARPGVILDHLEQVLLVAEEWRKTRQIAQAPEMVDLAGGLPEQQPAPSNAEAAAGDVDPIALATEFAGLLQDRPEGDEEVQ